jgi:hypothetical protein
MNGIRNAGRAVIATALAAALLPAASAPAATVTVGSPLTGAFSTGLIGGGGAATIANLTLREPGANATSPVNGTVVAWRITGAVGGPFKLRVLRPAGVLALTGAGTSAPQIPSGTGTETFTTSLPIQGGDLIALDDSDSNDQLGGASLPGGTIAAWLPPLQDGATGSPSITFPDKELGFNAEVRPSNAFRFVRVKRNRKKGTARLTVNVPNPGELVLSGKGVKRAGASGAIAAKRVPAPGEVELLIKAKGKKKRKLNETGKVKVKPNVTYTPTGGDPSSQSRKLKLKKR